MRHTLKLLVAIFIPLMMASCGGGGAAAGEAGLVGSWKADMSSFDLVLGDGIPEEMKGMIEAQKGQAMEKASSESDKLSIEFTDAGKMVLTAEGDTEELDYSFDGSKLNVKGEIEGEKVDFDLGISEVTADKFTIKMTGEEILDQIKAKRPELLSQVPPAFDIAAMVKGCSVAISFKK